MFTTCPKCDLTLTVTAADLRTGQGYVRCGRCASVFNALINLTEERPAAAVAPVEQLDDSTDEGLEFNSQRAQVADIFIAPSTDASDISSGTFESIVLEGGNDEDEDPESEAAFQRSLETLLAAPDKPTAPADTPPDDLALAAAVAARAPAHRRTIHPALASAAIAVEPAAAVFPDAEAVAEGYLDRLLTARVQRFVLIGSVVLGVALLAQIIHASRHALAGRPLWSGPVTALYGMFGAKLEPRWNVTAYEVRQLGAETLPGDASRLLVRASVRNASERAMPLPRLRLTLQDRYGNPVSTRDLEPAEYLPAPLQGAVEIGPDQRVDTDIRVIDPGRAAMGFEIDACLPNPNETVRCANDERRRVAASN